MIQSHDIKINYGKHKGQLITRIPISYIRWMINEKAPMYEIAQVEFERRGDTMPKIELSGHAIDKASLRVRKIWHQTRKENEGIYSWLQRISIEALKFGEKSEGGKIKYLGMKLVITEGEEYPSLKTIMT